MRILLQNITILPMTNPKEIIEKGYVIIQDQVIVAVGPEILPRRV